MSEPGLPPTGEAPPPESPAPTVPELPFRPEKVGRGTPGCGKPLAIGCGLVLLLVLAAFALFVFKAHDLLAWSIEAMEEGVVERLADDVGQAERERLSAAIAAAAERARSKDVDLPALQALQRQFIRLAQGQTIEREELEEFITALETFARSPGPGAVPGNGGGRGEPALPLETAALG